jgi:NAD-dependent dihydropyrimidine dehydrogenase PreA subunit
MAIPNAEQKGTPKREGEEGLPKKEGGEIIILIKMNPELCTGCGTCVDNCPNRVFQLVRGKSQAVNSKDCMACYLCETVCPRSGIKITE